MGRWVAILVLAAGCHTATPLAWVDGGSDAGAVDVDAGKADAGHDAGQAVDAGYDAGVDAGPPCACPSGPCCDACAPLPTTTLCLEDIAIPANTCYSLGLINGVPRYGYGSPRTRIWCGASGACDGTVVADDYYQACPMFKQCQVQADGRAICVQ